MLHDGSYRGRVLGDDNGEHTVAIAALDLGMDDPFHLDDAQFAKVTDRLMDLKHDLLSLYSTADEALQHCQQMFPHLVPAYAAAGILSFALSMDETLTTLLVTGTAPAARCRCGSGA